VKALPIDGNTLTLAALREVVEDRRPVELEAEARKRVRQARAVVEKLLRGKKVAYGVNTGVGQLSDVRIPPAQIRQLQVNLVRSHSAGVGEPLAEAEVRALMLLRANSLAKGHSGVRPAVIETLCRMLNRCVHPVIPSQGSVGASGDLAPLAHMASVIIGEGEALLGGRRLGGAEALKQARIEPLRLEAKEAISIINGTQGMLAVGALALLQAETLTDSADVIGAMSLDALRGTDVAFDGRIHRARPHAGQQRVARNLRRLLEGSQIRESHRDCARVQDAYSLRCMPQVHGAVRDTLSFCRRVFEIEMNSAVDNPLVFPGTAQPRTAVPHRPATSHSDEILSGGNFHGQPLAFALDFLGIALTSLAGISERRIERLVNPALNEGLPAFLATDPGLNSGFMMAQVTAAALVSENKVVAHPASADSIPTSGNKEDYVSMGMAAALKLKRILENTTSVLAIEALAAAQGLDFLAPLKSSKRIEQAKAAVRAAAPAMERDRVLAEDFARAALAILEGGLTIALR
jgi:histidine ammonia-lyase